jgi:hypothetical protein
MKALLMIFFVALCLVFLFMSGTSDVLAVRCLYLIISICALLCALYIKLSNMSLR